MKVFNTYWVYMAFAAICLIPKTMVLVHTLRGNQSKWVLTVTGLLMLYSAMTFAMFYCTILAISPGHEDKYTALYISSIVCYTISAIAFNVSHAMLAEKYTSAKQRALSTLTQQDQTELP
jgi:hypothetical protein